MKKYFANVNASFSDKDANIIGKYIEEKFGDFVTPQDILQDAADVKSVLHPFFQWDNNKAANEYRLWQARQILRCLVVVTKDEQETKAFHNITLQKGGQSYVSFSTALKSPEIWKQVVEKAFREVESWSIRYRQYKELQPIMKAVQKTRGSYYEKVNNHRAKNRNTTNSIKNSNNNAGRYNSIAG